MERTRTAYFAMLAGTLLASACGRAPVANDRSGAAPSASVAAHPAPWEPVDEGFRGCEGG